MLRQTYHTQYKPQDDSVETIIGSHSSGIELFWYRLLPEASSLRNQILQTVKHKASQNFLSQIFLKENILYAVKKGKNLLLNLLATSEPCYLLCTPPLGCYHLTTSASPSRSACLLLTRSSQNNHNEIPPLKFFQELFIVVGIKTNILQEANTALQPLVSGHYYNSYMPVEGPHRALI